MAEIAGIPTRCPVSERGSPAMLSGRTWRTTSSPAERPNTDWRNSLVSRWGVFLPRRHSNSILPARPVSPTVSSNSRWANKPASAVMRPAENSSLSRRLKLTRRAFHPLVVPGLRVRSKVNTLIFMVHLNEKHQKNPGRSGKCGLRGSKSLPRRRPGCALGGNPRGQSPPVVAGLTPAFPSSRRCP